MTTPDLTLLTAGIVAALKAFDDLSPLTSYTSSVEDVDTAGNSLSAIVDANLGDLLSQIEFAVGRRGVAVSVRVAAALEDNSQTIEPFYAEVKVEIDVYEFVEANRITAASAIPGTGTGLAAWSIADRIVAALKFKQITGPAKPYELYAVAPGIVDVTGKDNAEAGIKVLRIHFTTKANSNPRTTP